MLQALVACHPTSQWLYQIARSVARRGAADPSGRQRLPASRPSLRRRRSASSTGPRQFNDFWTVMKRMPRLEPFRRQLRSAATQRRTSRSPNSPSRPASPGQLLHAALRGAERPTQPPREAPSPAAGRRPNRAAHLRHHEPPIQPEPSSPLSPIVGKNSSTINGTRQALARVRTTREIANTLKSAQGHLNHSIPVAQPLDLPQAELRIPPYTLGAWLGDGCSWNCRDHLRRSPARRVHRSRRLHAFATTPDSATPSQRPASTESSASPRN